MRSSPRPIIKDRRPPLAIKTHNKGSNKLWKKKIKEWTSRNYSGSAIQANSVETLEVEHLYNIETHWNTLELVV